MSYHVALSLKIFHAFWGNETPPLRIVPHDPRGFSRLDLLAKPGAASLDIVAETAKLTDPVIVSFDVIANDPNIAALTAGFDWASLPRIDLTADTDDVDGIVTAYAAPVADRRMPGDPLMRIDLAIPATGLRRVTLRCDAPAALWAYHITGKRAVGPLQIVDAAKAVAFEDLGETALPDGTPARVLRSTAPIALRYRSAMRFALEETQDPPFDPITLIPVLPVAGINLRPAPDMAAAASLQSDIFVSLW
ncbi:hypothetical protein [Yoonia sp.]|jgi:hypothetical protein|uniref:hypothetical protein n=1 Tax=Yoonia sp. TaxID=2212373 RepID=UPI0025E79ADA|nr:hypothetical protein [Yoonia sp.]